MKADILRAEVVNKSADLESVAKAVIRQPRLLQPIFAGLDAERPREKYGCLKLLRLISEIQPRVLYPEIDRFFRLMNNTNNILKWGAIIIIGNLAVADSEGKIDPLIKRYLKPLSGCVLITAANAIRGAGKVAKAKPHLASEIALAFLRVETANYGTDECRNVALGHAIESLDQFFEEIKQKQPVLDFVRRQLGNGRNSVRVKAARFLKRHSPQSGHESGVS